MIRLASVRRQLAIPVYRALVAAGPAGLTRAELGEEAWAESGIQLDEVIFWMRSKGVDIRAVPDPPGPTRFVLAARLPAAWEQTVE